MHKVDPAPEISKMGHENSIAVQAIKKTESQVSAYSEVLLDQYKTLMQQRKRHERELHELELLDLKNSYSSHEPSGGADIGGELGDMFAEEENRLLKKMADIKKRVKEDIIEERQSLLQIDAKIAEIVHQIKADEIGQSAEIQGLLDQIRSL